MTESEKNIQFHEHCIELLLSGREESLPFTFINRNNAWSQEDKLTFCKNQINKIKGIPLNPYSWQIKPTVSTVKSKSGKKGKNKKNNDLGL